MSKPETYPDVYDFIDLEGQVPAKKLLKILKDAIKKYGEDEVRLILDYREDSSNASLVCTRPMTFEERDKHDAQKERNNARNQQYKRDQYLALKAEFEPGETK